MEWITHDQMIKIGIDISNPQRSRRLARCPAPWRLLAREDIAEINDWSTHND